MTDEPSPEDWFFDVPTPLGFRVHVTPAYWSLIVTEKHPAMTGREADVEAILRDPSEIRVSRVDASVHLFYRLERIGRWICAVARRKNGEGFLITTYPTDAIKEGERIWPK
jgi:hypothetical protein